MTAATRSAVRERHRRKTRWTVNVDVIERTRILRGWTVVELSRVAHVDRGTFSDLIQGQRQSTLGTVQAIASALGLALSDVIVFVDASDPRGPQRPDTSQ